MANFLYPILGVPLALRIAILLVLFPSPALAQPPIQVVVTLPVLKDFVKQVKDLLGGEVDRLKAIQ